MKNRIASLAVLGVLALAAASNLSAATVQANIPFAFKVGTKTMAAGNYTLNLNNGLAYFRGATSGEAAFKLVNGQVTEETTKLVFTCDTKGDACSFTEILPGNASDSKQTASNVRVVTGVLLASN